MSKKSRNGVLAQEGLRLAEGEPVYVGCDVHADKYQLALWSPQRQDWAGEWVQPADDQALLRRLGSFRPQVIKVVYEAGPTGFGLARTLLAEGFQCEVIAPNLTPKAPTEPDKCDKLDARRLACQAAQPHTLKAVHIPAAAQEQERQVWRWVRGDAYARMMFNHYQAGTASKLKAIVAVARKLAIILWNLLRGPLPYVPGLVRVPPGAVGLKPKPSKPAREKRTKPDRAGVPIGLTS